MSRQNRQLNAAGGRALRRQQRLVDPTSRVFWSVCVSSRKRALAETQHEVRAVAVDMVIETSRVLTSRHRSRAKRGRGDQRVTIRRTPSALRGRHFDLYRSDGAQNIEVAANSVGVEANLGREIGCSQSLGCGSQHAEQPPTGRVRNGVDDVRSNVASEYGSEHTRLGGTQRC